jgi:hypothetical protein
MARQSKNEVGKPESLSTTTVCPTMALQAPSVADFIGNSGGDYISIRVSYRGPYDYLAVAKRYGADGGVEVCFGSGYDWWSSLFGLQGSLSKEAWRPDKFVHKDG